MLAIGKIVFSGGHILSSAIFFVEISGLCRLWFSLDFIKYLVFAKCFDNELKKPELRQGV